MSRIRIDASDFKRFLRRMQSLNFDRPLEASSTQLIRNNQARIVRGVDPDSRPFVPLAPSTLRQKRGAGILRETNAMINAFTSRRIGSNQRSIENTDRKAPFHQFGTSKIPQRELLGISEKDADNIEAICADFIERETRL